MEMTHPRFGGEQVRAELASFVSVIHLRPREHELWARDCKMRLGLLNSHVAGIVPKRRRTFCETKPNSDSPAVADKCEFGPGMTLSTSGALWESHKELRSEWTPDAPAFTKRTHQLSWNQLYAFFEVALRI